MTFPDEWQGERKKVLREEMINNSAMTFNFSTKETSLDELLTFPKLACQGEEEEKE